MTLPEPRPERSGGSAADRASVFDPQPAPPQEPSPLEPDPSEVAPQPAHDSISLIEIANVLLRWRWLIVTLPFGLFLVTVVAQLLRAPQYTAAASFMPQRSDATARNLGSMAAQLGIRIGNEGQGESPAFYTELITSRAILVPALESRYTSTPEGQEVRGTLIELYDVEAETEALRRDAALRALRDNIGVTTSSATDIVHLSVTADSPELSQQIAARILELVNQFNLETRQSRATEERRFIEERMAEAQTQLRDAEDGLQRFLQRNRDFRNSPELGLLHGRLEREVGMRQQVFNTLAQAYEQARIEEVRNTPVITIVEPPVQPARRDARGTVVRGILALATGVMVAAAIAFLLEFLRHGRRQEERGYPEFQRLRREAREDLVRPWRRFHARVR